MAIPRGVHVQGRARSTTSSTTRSRCSCSSIDRHGIPRRCRASTTTSDAKRACASTPTASSRASERRPERGHGRGARARPLRAGVRRAAVGALPAGPHTRRSRSTTRRCTRSTRSASSSTSRSSCTPACPGRASAFAPQDVALLDEVCWFFPELKFVTRHGCEPWTELDGEAAAEVAEPLLLDQRVRTEALPQRHHRLREHPRRRQDHLRGLLPRRASASTASSPSCPTCRSATTSGRSSCTRTRPRVFKLARMKVGRP